MGNDGNAENQGGNVGSQGGNDGNAVNQGGNTGNRGREFRLWVLKMYSTNGFISGHYINI